MKYLVLLFLISLRYLKYAIAHHTDIFVKLSALRVFLVKIVCIVGEPLEKTMC